MKIRFFSAADMIKTAQTPIRRIRSCDYTPIQEQYMIDNWQRKTTQEIADYLGKSKASVQTHASKKLHLKKNEEALFRARSIGQKTRDDAYSEIEKQYIRDNYQLMTLSQIAQYLGRTRGSVKSMAQKTLFIQKTPEAISAIAKRSNSGQFQKGNLPANTVFGDQQIIRIRNNPKRGIKTKYIRIGFAKWQEYQHYIWQQAHGPVPKGMILAFVNGDRMDVRLDNLELITMKENRLRNSGSLQLSDGYVANTIAWRDKAMKDELLKHPELIDLKRKQLQLNRLIKNG